MNNKRLINVFLSSTSLRTCIWIVSIAAWMFSLIERVADLLISGRFTMLELAQVVLMAIGLMSLFILKPRMARVGSEGLIS